MKRFSFRVPKQMQPAIIIVDDENSGMLKSEYWKARINKGHLEIYKSHLGCTIMFGRALLGITEDNICVLHRNGDERDYRKANLMPIPRGAHTKLLHLMQRTEPSHARGPRRAQGFCKRGHAYEGENVMKNGQSNQCRACYELRRKNKAVA